MPAKGGDSGAPQGLSWSWELDLDSLVRGLSEAGLGDVDDPHSPDCPDDPHISDRLDDPRSPDRPDGSDSPDSPDDLDALDVPDGGQFGAGVLAGRVAERLAPAPDLLGLLAMAPARDLGDGQPRRNPDDSQAWHAENALVHAIRRLSADEPAERLDSQRELGSCQRLLPAEAAVPQPGDIGGQGVFGPVDDPQVLRPPALDPRLGDAAPSSADRLGRLDHHALAASPGEFLPPRRHGLIGAGVGEIGHDITGGLDERVRGGKAFGGLHVPLVVPAKTGARGAREQLKGGEPDVPTAA